MSQTPAIRRLVLISNLLALLFLPLLIWQAWRLNHRVLRLHEADDVSGIVSGPGPALRLLLMGESTSAGVGASSNDEALAGHLARALAARLGRAVHWRVIGINGYTIRQTRRYLCPRVAGGSADVVLIVHGFNDTVGWTSPTHWTRELQTVMRQLADRLHHPVFVLSGIPLFRAFPHLPRPTRDLLGMRADALALASQDLAAEGSDLGFVPLGELSASDDYCVDGFHPSSRGYALWAEALTDPILARLRPSR